VSRDTSQVIREIMQAVLQLDTLPPPGRDLLQSNEPRWDSLGHVNLIYSIESELQIQFDAGELAELDSLHKLVSAAERHLSGAA
jgi:acyl carrier protein